MISTPGRMQLSLKRLRHSAFSEYIKCLPRTVSVTVQCTDGLHTSQLLSEIMLLKYFPIPGAGEVDCHAPVECWLAVCRDFVLWLTAWSKKKRPHFTIALCSHTTMWQHTGGYDMTRSKKKGEKNLVVSRKITPHFEQQQFFWLTVQSLSTLELLFQLDYRHTCNQETQLWRRQKIPPDL